MHRELPIDRRRGGDDPGVGIDLEEAIWIIGKAIGNCIGRCIEVERTGGNSHGRSDSNVFIDFIRRCVSLCRYRDIEFVKIIDRDGENLRCDGAVAGGGLNGDGSIRAMDFAIDGYCGGDYPVLASIWKRPSGLLVRL